MSNNHKDPRYLFDCSIKGFSTESQSSRTKQWAKDFLLIELNRTNWFKIMKNAWRSELTRSEMRKLYWQGSKRLSFSLCKEFQEEVFNATDLNGKILSKKKSWIKIRANIYQLANNNFEMSPAFAPIGSQTGFGLNFSSGRKYLIFQLEIVLLKMGPDSIHTCKGCRQNFVRFSRKRDFCNDRCKDKYFKPRKRKYYERKKIEN